MVEFAAQFDRVRVEDRPSGEGQTYKAILAQSAGGLTYELVGYVTSRAYLYYEPGFTASVEHPLDPTLWQVGREHGKRPSVLLVGDRSTAEQDIKEKLAGYVQKPTLGPAFRLRHETLVPSRGHYGIWECIDEPVSPALEDWFRVHAGIGDLPVTVRRCAFGCGPDSARDPRSAVPVLGSEVQAEIMGGGHA